VNETESSPEVVEETPSAATTETEPAVTEELRLMGKRLAAALIAATQTSEAEALKGDLRQGMSDLRVEIDQALSRPQVQSLRGKAQAPVVTQIRHELANALRVLNRAIDRAAESLTPQTPPETEEPAPTVEADPE